MTEALTISIVGLATIAAWFIFKEADSFGWRFLLTLSATGLAFWIVTAAHLICTVATCVPPVSAGL